MADKVVAHGRQEHLTQNQMRVAEQRREKQRAKQQLEAAASAQLLDRRAAFEQQRRDATEIVRRKRLDDAQERLNKSERVVASQRENLEAKLRLNQERAERISRIR